MLIPLRTDVSLRTTPYVNWVLIALNVIIFGISATHPESLNPYLLDTRQPLLYQYFTYAFLHAGWMHIAGNMLFLYIFGNNVNDKLGNFGYLAFYLAAAVFSGIAYVLSQTHEGSILGASGAIAGVTGAYLVLLPRSNITIFYFWFLVPGVMEIASLWFVLFFFVFDVFLGLSGGDNVAHSAHIGGTIFGFTTAIALLALHLLPRDPFDVVALIQRWNRRRQYRDMVSKGYNPFEHTKPGDAPPPAPPPTAATQRIMELRAALSEALAAHDAQRATDLYAQLKTIDRQQVLSRQAQLDVANHLAAQQRFAEAAEAYETYLSHYPKADQIERVELMLGLICARYLSDPARARNYLSRALEHLHDDRASAMARQELTQLDLTSPPTPPLTGEKRP